MNDFDMSNFDKIRIRSISDGRPVSSVTNVLSKTKWHSFIAFPNGAMRMQLFSTELEAIEATEKFIKDWQNRQERSNN